MKGAPKNFPQYTPETLEEIDYSLFPPFEVNPPPKKAAAAQRKGTGWIHPNLPQLPMTLLILGPRKRGKSVALRNMIDPKRKGSYGSALQPGNIVVYSPTKEYDDTLTELNLKNVYGPPDTVGAIVDDIKRTQEKNQLQNNMADVLIVLEDCTVVPDAWEHLRMLGYSGRHYGMHTIAVAHKLTAVDRGIRTQQQQWMIFKPHEESERESILDAFAAKGPSRGIWRKALYRAWETKYNFVYIDFERGGDVSQVYRSGFNEPLFTDEEIVEMASFERDGIIRIQRPGSVMLPSDLSTNSADLPREDKPTKTIDKKKKRGRPRKQ
jgi:hypothetical protein